MSDLSDYRKVYEKDNLLESEVDKNPMMQFQKWFYEAEAIKAADEVNAMSVSTIGLDGFPKTRVVLLKKYDEDGFVFYTNYHSEKGKAILANPHVCLSFFLGKSRTSGHHKGNCRKSGGCCFGELFPFPSERKSVRSGCFSAKRSN